MEILRRVFKVRSGEGTKVFLMFLYCFFAVSAFIIARIIAGTLFLHRSGIKNLPYLYLLVAFIVAGITWMYNRYANRLRLDRAILIVTTLLIVSVLWLWFALSIQLSWAPAVFYVFAEVMGGLLIIQFGTFVNELFNSREVKRLGGLIWAGGVAANLVSFPMRSLSKVIPAESFLLIIAGALGAILVIVYHLSRSNRGMLEYAQSTRHLLNKPSTAGTSSKSTSKPSRDAKGLKTLSELKWSISAIVAVSILTVTVVDYQFKVVARLSFADESQLADFFFTVYAYSGVISIFIQVFAVSWILERFGIRQALMVLPVSLMGSSVAGISFKSTLSVWAAKASDLVLRYTLNDPTIKMLYQPLPPSWRRRAQAVDGGIVRPLSQGAGGLLVLLFSFILPITVVSDAFYLSGIIAFFVLLWSVIIFVLYRAYVKSLLVSKPQRDRNARNDLWEDIPAEVIESALLSGDPDRVLNTLDIISESDKWKWFGTVYTMLKQYNAGAKDEASRVLRYPEVRRRALEYLEKSGNRSYSSEILKLFSDEDEDVVAAAIQAYCSIEHERAVASISAFLAHSHPKIKAASIAGLIRYGGLDGILLSVAELKNMIDSQQPDQRRSAAEVLGLIKISSFYQSLFKLILDDNIDVSREAIISAGRMQSKELLPQVIYMLRIPSRHNAAIKALTLYGEDLFEDLIRQLRDPYTHLRIKIGIVSVLQNMRSQSAADELLNLLPEPNDELASAIVSALSSIRLKRSDLHIDVRYVREVLHAEVERFYQHLLDEYIAQEILPSPLLIDALRDKQKITMQRIFGLLALLYPPRMVEVVVHDIQSEHKAARANAMEIIDNVFDAETRNYLIPALDDIDIHDKILRGEKFFKLKRRDQFEFVEYLLESSDSWLVASTLYSIAQNGMRQFLPYVKFFLDHEDALLRESALFALSLLDPADARFAGERLASDEDVVVSRYAKSLASAALY